MKEKLQDERQAQRTFTWEGAPISRRAFFNRMGAAGLGVAAAAAFGSAGLAGCGGGGGGLNLPGGNPPPGGNDPFAALGFAGPNVNVRALNYALTLEVLEADLYRQALNKASGRPLTAPLDGQPNPRSTAVANGAGAPPSGSTGAYSLDPTVGPGNLPQEFVQPGFLYLVQFAYVEAAHREFLRNALGANAKPLKETGFAFPGGPGETLKAILDNILPLEETGVRAYLGAVPFITDKGILQTAGTIYSTEARHSAAVSYIVNNGDTGPNSMTGDKEVTANPPSEETFEKFLEPATVVNAVKVYFV